MFEEELWIYFEKSHTTGKCDEFKKELKLKDLIMLGIGAIIGTGIFVVTGTASAEYAGPALILSFVVAGIVVVLSGLSFCGICFSDPCFRGRLLVFICRFW